MPVKKTKSKKETKKTTKKVNKKVKKEIRQAVDDIPGLMFEHIKIENPEKSEPENINPILDENKAPSKNLPYQEPKGSRKLLWFSVILFTTIIFAIWIVNSWATFRDIKSRRIEEQIDLIGETKNNFNNAITKINQETGATTTPIDDLEKIKNQIKNNLESIIIYDSETSTTATSTN